MNANCILLTGANGKVARQVRPHLASLCTELRLTDIVPFKASLSNESVHVADLADACTLVPTAALLDGSVTLTLATVAAGSGAEILSELADPHADNPRHTIA